MRNCLIFICCALWMAAGVNVVRMGVLALGLSEMGVAAMVVGGVVTFLMFGFMFMKISLKNVKRIEGLPSEKLKVWNCMPLKSFLIMAFMIALGVTLRRCAAVPRGFIAFFYIGLGSALTLAGLLYLYKGIARIAKA